MKIIRRIENGVQVEWHLPEGIDTPEQFIEQLQRDKDNGIIPKHHNFNFECKVGTSKIDEKE